MHDARGRVPATPGAVFAINAFTADGPAAMAEMAKSSETERRRIRPQRLLLAGFVLCALLLCSHNISITKIGAADDATLSMAPILSTDGGLQKKTAEGKGESGLQNCSNCSGPLQPTKTAAPSFKHNICVAVLGYTKGSIDSRPAQEMLGVMRTWAGPYRDSTYFMLDSMGRDSNESAAELCERGGFPRGHCIYMGEVNRLADKIMLVFETLRERVLSDCRFFLRADSDEYMYLPATERWVSSFPSVDDRQLIFSSVRGKLYVGRIRVKFPGASFVMSRPLIEKVFGGREWVAARKSLWQEDIYPREDDVFVGYMLSFCNHERTVQFVFTSGNIIMGGKSGPKANMEKWRMGNDARRHCWWKVHKIEPAHYDELHRFYANHTLHYNASALAPTRCQASRYDNGMISPNVEDKNCSDCIISLPHCKDYVDGDVPKLLNRGCPSDDAADGPVGTNGNMCR